MAPPSADQAIGMNLEGTLIGNAKARLRMLAGTNSYLWQTYMRLVGQPLPNPRQIDLIVEGYPRSGNTYAEHMLRIMCPGLRWISHTHSVGTLLWAQKHGIPSLILLREPQEAAVSLYIYRMQQVALHLCFKEWEAFYRNARELDVVSFVLFDSLISNTEASLCSALSKIGLASSIKEPLPPNPGASFVSSHDHDKWHLREVRGIVYGEEQGNLPSERRERIKRDIFAHIRDDSNRNLLSIISQCSNLAKSFS